VGAVTLKAKICVDSWAGGLEEDCEIIGETRTKYVCRMLKDGRLPRRNVKAGDIVKVPKRAVRIEAPDHEREIPRQDKTQEESALPEGRGESLVAQLDSAVNQAEQLRGQQVQQQYSDQLGVYVQEKAEQIDRLQSSLAASLTSEQAQLQAIQQRAPGWTAVWVAIAVDADHPMPYSRASIAGSVSAQRWVSEEGVLCISPQKGSIQITPVVPIRISANSSKANLFLRKP
jgi:multidrug efflux pump subunit AcrA (membrane-fusion protein)